MQLTDTEVVNAADLIAIESNLGDVIAKESIVLSGSLGLVQRTMNDGISRLLAASIQFESYPMANGTELSANHIAAVYNMGPGPRNIPRFRPQQFSTQSQIANMWSPMKTWFAHETLISIYQTAWNRKLKEDKYKQKLQEYKELVELKTFPRFKTQGLPIVMSPLSMPAALFDFNPGSWGQANLTAAPQPAAGHGVGGSSTAIGGNFQVSISYVDQVSQSNTYVSAAMPGNAESAPTAPLIQTVTPGQVISVNIATLNPPQGIPPPVLFSQGWLTPRKATGWNIYAGPIGGTMTLQTLVPVPIAQTSALLSGDPIPSVYYLGTGQSPDYNYVLPSLIWRG